MKLKNFILQNLPKIHGHGNHTQPFTCVTPLISMATLFVKKNIEESTPRFILQMRRNAHVKRLTDQHFLKKLNFIALQLQETLR